MRGLRPLDLRFTRALFTFFVCKVFWDVVYMACIVCGGVGVVGGVGVKGDSPRWLSKYQRKE